MAETKRHVLCSTKETRDALLTIVSYKETIHEIQIAGEIFKFYGPAAEFVKNCIFTGMQKLNLNELRRR